MHYYGTYAGRVVDTADPVKLGRIKARVPTLHGMEGGLAGLIEDADLPWCLPAGLPAGGSQESGGVSWIPVAGDQVWIRFLDGELEKPIWEWGNQNIPQGASFGSLPVHAYDENGAALRRAAFARYSHWWEILPDRHSMWTKSGYFFEIVDEKTPGTPSGHLSWLTAKSHILELDDATETLTGKTLHIDWLAEDIQTYATKSVELTTPLVVLNVGSFEIASEYGSFLLDGLTRTARGFQASLNSLAMTTPQGTTFHTPFFAVTPSGASFGADDITQSPSSETTSFGVRGDTVTLGYGSNDPLVRLSDLVKALKEVKKQFDAHTHTNVDRGNDISGPPATPLAPTATGSSKVSAESASSVSGAF